MKIAVLKIRKEPHYRRAAFESGLKRLGYALFELSRGPLNRDDLLIIWNKKRGIEENEANAWEERGGTVIVAENGYLQRVDKSMYALSTHGHNGSGWYPIGDEDRFTPLGFELKPWQDNKDGHWLVCGQRGIGSALMASPPMWAEKTVKKLTALGLKARLRQHPGNFVAKVPLDQDLKGAKMCAIWSSGSGVRALVEGIPVQHSAPHWICAGAGPECREEVMNRMAHGQWRHEEIATGEPFARMAAHNWGKK
jgi:hypothetical protein